MISSNKGQLVARNNSCLLALWGSWVIGESTLVGSQDWEYMLVVFLAVYDSTDSVFEKDRSIKLGEYIVSLVKRFENIGAP